MVVGVCLKNKPAPLTRQALSTHHRNTRPGTRTRRRLRTGCTGCRGRRCTRTPRPQVLETSEWATVKGCPICASAGREGVGWVVRVRAAVSVPPLGPSNAFTKHGIRPNGTHQKGGESEGLEMAWDSVWGVRGRGRVRGRAKKKCLHHVRDEIPTEMSAI